MISSNASQDIYPILDLFKNIDDKAIEDIFVIIKNIENCYDFHHLLTLRDAKHPYVKHAKDRETATEVKVDGDEMT
ncbi:unnamed protein product [Rhizophagus irregularis]|nr:unnamed protein product [Rhizophagus irregularis]